MGGRHSASNYQRAARRRKRRFLRWRSLLLIPGLLVVLLGVSLVGAAVSPGNVSYEAKWADWLRAHHAGLIAQKFEEVYFSAVAPAKGGTPKGLNKIPVTVQVAPSTTDPQQALSDDSTGPLYEHLYHAACDYYYDRASGPPTAEARPPRGPPIARRRRQVAAHRPPRGRRARHVRSPVPGR